jgi:hypothetical protein
MSTRKTTGGTGRIAGVAIAAAAAGLFAMGYSAPVLADDTGKVQCEGVNSCKGASDCKSAHNACKGQNSCKGKGWKELTGAECDKAKMEKKAEAAAKAMSAY